MTNFIITGTSGVGKSYLESVLENKYGFYPLIKFMDRPLRPEETSNPKVGFLSRDEFQKQISQGQFAFTLEYSNQFYGWKKSDIESNKDKNQTIAITLESLKKVFDSLPDFRPVLLTIDLKEIDLIVSRMKKRENYDQLNQEQRQIIDENIEKRIKLTKDELKNINEYIQIVENHNGKVFYIKDDTTLFDEVIPHILNQID